MVQKTLIQKYWSNQRESLWEIETNLVSISIEWTSVAGACSLRQAALVCLLISECSECLSRGKWGGNFIANYFVFLLSLRKIDFVEKRFFPTWPSVIEDLNRKEESLKINWKSDVINFCSGSFHSSVGPDLFIL